MQKWLPGWTLIYLATYGRFAITNSLENDRKWPFSPLEIDLISLLLSVETGAFYMDPMRGSCKLDLSTSGCYKTRLSNVEWSLGTSHDSCLSGSDKNSGLSRYYLSCATWVAARHHLIKRFKKALEFQRDKAVKYRVCALCDEGALISYIGPRLVLRT